MARRDWKRKEPTSLRHAMELCLEHARVRQNFSVDNVADLMGLPSKWALYKWMENGRMPAILIRPFEAACGAEYITRYLAHSAHKLIVNIPTGRKASSRDINGLQVSFSQALALLLEFYQAEEGAAGTTAALTQLMEDLAWHRGNVDRHQQPELEFGGGA